MSGGHVALVGGGPGDPELITLRGWELLKHADVVLVDALAPRALLAGLRPDVLVVDVGKHPHRPEASTSQERINDLLLEHARAGRRVVRLKGGDPFVFGRGGEEAAACRAARIPCEVVPGVTSAVAVPGLAGIPVTHRGVTQEVSIVSGHVAPSDPATTVDWERLGAGSGTVVVLMGTAHLAEIAAALRGGGRPADTPVAVCSEGATPRAAVLVSTLGDVARACAESRVRPPAVVVVGEVVGLREHLAP